MPSAIKGTLIHAACLFTICASSCQSENIETPDEKELYNREFIKQFGITGINHEWTAATRVTASIDPSLLKDAAEINIYTAWPGNQDCTIAASFRQTTQNLEFDYPGGQNLAYVQILNGDGKVTHASYHKINGNRMSVGRAASRAATTEATPYAYDLTDNKSWGTIPVNRDYIANFWETFTTNEGKRLNISSSTIKYPDYTVIELKQGDNSNDGVDIENGWYFDNWDSHTHIDGLPADIGSDCVEFRITYSTPESPDNPAQMKFADANWNGISFTGADGLVLPHTNGEKSTIIIKADGIGNMKGNKTYVFGVNYTIHSIEFKETPGGTAPLSEIFNIYGFSTRPVSTFDGFRDNYLKPDNSTDEYGYSASDLVPIVGSKGIFNEEINHSTQRCNLETYREQLHLDDRMDYIVADNNSEISLDYFFGSTSYFNSFGYFYYTDEEATLPEARRMAVLLKKPKFLLMYDACPGSNILLQETEGSEWIYDSGLHSGTEIVGPDSDDEGKDCGDGWEHCKRFANLISNAENGSGDSRFRSAKYRLVYYSPDKFDDNGRLKPGATGTYGFPQGTHVAFFVVTNGQYSLDKNGDTQRKINHRRIAFSVPLMNKYIGNTLNEGHTHSGTGFPSTMITGTGSPSPWTAFVSYSWNGKIVMGVEDYFAESENGINGGDHDMNDMLFYVNGKFVKDREELNPEKPVMQSWIIACEDLGGTLDFDFNDVVFGVSHVAGSTTATVTALAAGGTLPVYIHSKYPQVINGEDVTNAGGYLIPPGCGDGEFHKWWGTYRPATSTINAISWAEPGQSVTIRVNDDFSLSSGNASRPDDNDDNMGGFKVIIDKGSNGITTITPPHDESSYEAPQMFLAPRSWLWPKEMQSIDKVYNGFIPWSDKWWVNRDGENATNIVFHTWRPIYGTAK